MSWVLGLSKIWIPLIFELVKQFKSHLQLLPHRNICNCREMTLKTIEKKNKKKYQKRALL